MAEIGTQEHQKSPYSTRYVSPFAFPKFIILAGVLLKKPLILKVKKYRQIYSSFVGENMDLSYLHAMPTSATFFSD